MPIQLLTRVDHLINSVISLIGEHGYQGCIQFLLDLPIELISRVQRENLMEQLLGGKPMTDNRSPEYWRMALSLMVKVMTMPTYYNVCLQYPLFLPR